MLVLKETHRISRTEFPSGKFMNLSLYKAYLFPRAHILDIFKYIETYFSP